MGFNSAFEVLIYLKISHLVQKWNGKTHIAQNSALKNR